MMNGKSQVVLVLLQLSCIAAFIIDEPASIHRNLQFKRFSFRDSHRLSLAVENSLVSVLAGSGAGAIGLIAAYPFDALKTKAQTYKGGLPYVYICMICLMYI
jgi:hypothetical protein